MAQLFDAVVGNDLPTGPNYNICPTDPVPVVIAGRRLVPMRWGFLPHWYKAENDGPLLINARAETVAEKPAFRAAARARRCILPASGFYEWTKDADGNRLPWFIFCDDVSGDGAGPMAFAGVWQEWQGQRTCAIVTCPAEGAMADIHHRMPVILNPDDWGLWLGENGRGAAALMDGRAARALRFHRVGRAVNSNRAEGPELIEPIDA